MHGHTRRLGGRNGGSSGGSRSRRCCSLNGAHSLVKFGVGGWVGMAAIRVSLTLTVWIVAMLAFPKRSQITGVGKVAGCQVTEGVARRSAGVRLLRDNVVIHEGTLKTLKRFKDEVREVNVGQECGMAFENYEDIREGDVIEIFEREEVERTLA